VYVTTSWGEGLASLEPFDTALMCAAELSHGCNRLLAVANLRTLTGGPTN
jgi:hypothetical protein